MLNSHIVELQKSSDADIKLARKRASQIKKFEEQSGIELVRNGWGFRTWGAFDIKKEDLGKVRKVVGQLRVVSKDVPYDYDKKGEISVSVEGRKNEFKGLQFKYRKPYNGGKKCKVVERTYTSKALECKIS